MFTACIANQMTCSRSIQLKTWIKDRVSLTNFEQAMWLDDEHDPAALEFLQDARYPNHADASCRFNLLHQFLKLPNPLPNISFS